MSAAARIATQARQAVRPRLVLPQARSFHTGIGPVLAAAASKKPSKAGQKTKQAGFKVKKSGDTKASRGGGGGAAGIGKLDHPLFKDHAGPSTLPDFYPDQITQQAVGTAISLPSDQNSAMKVFGLPLSIQKEVVHLVQPFSVVRDVTMDTLAMLDKAGQGASSESRTVLSGSTGSGKSMLLIQAVNYCAEKNWVVLYVPRAIQWVNSTTPYAYDARTQTFNQPALAQTLLDQLVKFNAKAFGGLTTTTEYVFEKKSKVEVGTTLEAFAQVGVRDATLATRVLEGVLEELAKQKKHPVLVAVDELQALYCRSSYRDPSYNLLQGYHFSTPRLLLEYAGGLKSFARGAFLGALSSTNTYFLPPLELTESLGLTPPTNAYAKRSSYLQTYAKGLKTLAVPAQMSVQEAASLFEVWEQTKTLHTVPSDGFFLAKYSETSGNPREFVNKGFLATLAS